MIASQATLQTPNHPEWMEKAMDKLRTMSEVVCMSNGRDQVHVFYGPRFDVEDREQAPLGYHVFWMGSKNSKKPPADSPWLVGKADWDEGMVIYTWIVPERRLVRDLLKKNFGIDAKFLETAN